MGYCFISDAPNNCEPNHLQTVGTFILMILPHIAQTVGEKSSSDLTFSQSFMLMFFQPVPSSLKDSSLENMLCFVYKLPKSNERFKSLIIHKVIEREGIMPL